MTTDLPVWQPFRRITLYYVVALVMDVLMIFIALLVGIVTVHRAGAFTVVAVIFILWSVPLFIATRRFAAWPCPRCCHPFVGFRGLLRVLPVKCSHCGQRVFADID
jgi:hypothetical protein